MAYKDHECQGGCHDNPKHSDRHNFISEQDIDTNFAGIVGFAGSAIINMLSKISREPRELKWQPNMGKNEPKMNKTSCLDRIVRRRNVVNGS